MTWDARSQSCWHCRMGPFLFRPLPPSPVTYVTQGCVEASGLVIAVNGLSTLHVFYLAPLHHFNRLTLHTRRRSGVEYSSESNCNIEAQIVVSSDKKAVELIRFDVS